MTTIKTLSIAALFSLLVVGCADSEPVFTSSGKQGHSIDCSGELSTWGDCYEEAGELCRRRGYKVLEKAGDKESSLFANKDILSSASTNTRSLIIQCK